MAERPSVLLVSPDYPPPLVGGSLTYIHITAQNYPGRLEILAGSERSAGLAEITDSRHQIRRTRLVVSSSPDPSRYRLVLMYVYLLTFALVRMRRYKAVLAHGGVVANALMFLAGRLRGVPVIGIEYGETIRMPLVRRGLKNMAKGWLIRKLYPLAGGNVVISAETRDMLIELGVNRANLRLIPPMLNRGKVTAGEASPTAAAPTVLTVGRLIERKGFHLVIDAAVQLRKSLPDLQVLIAGDGPIRSQLERQIATLGLQATVKMLGRVSDEELARRYQECHVFVLASIMLPDGDSEDSPSTAIEASSYGKPVVIGAAGGTSSCVDHEVTGYRIDPSDQALLVETIERLLVDRELAARMGRAGQRKIEEQHNPAKAGRVLGDFVEALARGDTSPTPAETVVGA
jgi:glycosyltransferase involved in cell wall biosynthesis